jgi:uncharacterized membrane protein YkvA (DUF1232 family)
VSKNTSSSNNQLGFIGELWQQAKLVFQLILDPKVPIYLKALPFAALAYLIFPVDFLPDFVPGLGQLDDLTILLLGAKVFIELAPKDIVAQYKDRMNAINEGSDLKSTTGKVVDKQGDEGDIIDGIIIDNDEEM